MRIWAHAETIAEIRNVPGALLPKRSNEHGGDFTACESWSWTELFLTCGMKGIMNERLLHCGDPVELTLGGTSRKSGAPSPTLFCVRSNPVYAPLLQKKTGQNVVYRGWGPYWGYGSEWLTRTCIGVWHGEPREFQLRGALSSFGCENKCKSLHLPG